MAQNSRYNLQWISTNVKLRIRYLYLKLGQTDIAIKISNHIYFVAVTVGIRAC